METIKVGATPRSRLEAGASLLAAARTTDTRLVKDRLAAFERAQRAYNGQPRSEPFAAFGVPAPAAILRLPLADDW